MLPDGGQEVLGPKGDLDVDIDLALVFLGDEPKNDEILWTNIGEFAAFLAKTHRDYLDEHNGRRPKNPTSTHSSISKKDFKAGLRHWSSIDEDSDKGG